LSTAFQRTLKFSFLFLQKKVMLEMVMVARGLPSRASKKAWQNDDKREAGAVFSRPEGGGKHKKRFKAMGGVKGRLGRPKG
jgi:hypothetical protein